MLDLGSTSERSFQIYVRAGGGRVIGLKVGYVEEVVTRCSRFMGGRSFKARVRVNVSSPMKHGCWLSVPKSQQF